MQIDGVSSDDVSTSGNDDVRRLPNPAVCRAKAAHWPGVVYCLVNNPGVCIHVRYFNDVAYCRHPEREHIIARSNAQENTEVVDAGDNRSLGDENTE